MRLALRKPHCFKRRKIGFLGVVGPQQNPTVGIAHHIGKKFFMLMQRRKPLIGALGVAIEYFQHRKRQNPLGGFLKGGIENLIHLMLNKRAGDRGRDHPKHHKPKPKRERQTRLKRSQQTHDDPKR